MTINQAYDSIKERVISKGFTKLPDLKTDELLPDVAIQRETDIIVKSSAFNGLTDNQKLVIIAHEWGHFLEKDIRDQFFKEGSISDEMIADWFVAHLSLAAELKQDRSYGDEYNKIIDIAENISEFVRKITIWEYRKLSSIL